MPKMSRFRKALRLAEKATKHAFLGVGFISNKEKDLPYSTAYPAPRRDSKKHHFPKGTLRDK